MKKIILFSIIILFSCGDMTMMDKYKSDGQNQNPARVKFHTKDTPGVWDKFKESHTPIVTRDSAKKNKIKVIVPFTGSKQPRHYIEVIVLMKGNKEIDKKIFSFNYDKAMAVFTLPDPDATDYTIVVKCNTHGMWVASVPAK